MTHLSPRELQDCLYAAITAAMRAGARIMSYYGRHIDISHKNYGYEKSDLVTAADKEAQQIIESVLIDYHPDIGFLGEEDGQQDNPSRFVKPYFWAVDPLDGTKAFIDHLNGFGVSIGLVAQDGTPILGVVYLPAFGDLFYGIVGKGAWHNERQIDLSKPNFARDKVKFLLSEAESIPKKNNDVYHEIVENFSQNKFKKIIPETLISPVHKGSLLLYTDSICVYYGVPRVPLGVSIWDFAAIAAIISAAGAHVSDMFGDMLDLNRKGSTFCHHRGFLFSNDKQAANLILSSFNKFKNEFNF
jgi:3'-phosphoadenosine 5'-phosphosulfate (PAPS) 3'-phosphatase